MSETPSPFREWGDGATDARAHVIEDISYAADAIVCRCGSIVRGVRDGSGWVVHGGSVLRMADVVERGDTSPAAEDRAGQAVRALTMLGRRCTCSTAAITDCPNYLEGDELDD